MVGVSALLAEAQTAGLTVRADGDRLVIRGPRKAEALAKALLAHKTEIMPLLRPRPAHKFPSAIAPRPLSEIYVTLPGDEWLADHFYYMRQRARQGRRE